MRVLFTSPIIEHPAAGGPELKVENGIKALSHVCELDIISRSTALNNELGDAAQFFRNYCTEFHVVPRLKKKRIKHRYIRVLKAVLYKIFSIECAEDARYIIDHIDRRNIDILWFGYGNISFPLIKKIKSMRPDLKVVCDTDSVWSRFVLRELPYAKGVRKLKIFLLGKKKEKEEQAWVNLCEATTAVSEVDAEYYRNIASNKKRIHIFSNVIDIDSYKISSPAPDNFKKPSIYLAGSFGHYNSAMDTAARWVLTEILPLVKKAVPEVHFYIIGRNSDVGFGKLDDPTITVTGKVESVLPYLYNTDVALVPLKFESGTRFKILEAGACRIPLVSTELGAEGISVEDGKHILIADEPEAFANAIIRLLSDRTLAAELAENCYQLVHERYSVESLSVEIKKILEYLKSD